MLVKNHLIIPKLILKIKITIIILIAKIIDKAIRIKKHLILKIEEIVVIQILDLISLKDLLEIIMVDIIKMVTIGIHKVILHIRLISL